VRIEVTREKRAPVWDNQERLRSIYKETKTNKNLMTFSN
jgi:hypothetical protein